MGKYSSDNIVNATVVALTRPLSAETTDASDATCHNTHRGPPHAMRQRGRTSFWADAGTRYPRLAPLTWSRMPYHALPIIRLMWEVGYDRQGKQDLTVDEGHPTKTANRACDCDADHQLNQL